MNAIAGIADVCMLLEGTYPYVRGGVSSWVHHILTGLSDLLNRTEWFDDLHGTPTAGLGDRSATIRSLWLRYFEGLERFTYRAANPIISLYSGNRARRVVDFADVEGLGRAAVELLSDTAQWKRYQCAGLARVRAYYTESAMIEAYRAVYRDALEA
jgi:hypothetical protein